MKILMLLLGMSSLPVFGAVQLKGTTIDAKSGAKLFDQVIDLDQGKMRIEITGKGKHQALIFRLDQKVIWVADFKNNTLVELTEDDLKRMKSRIDMAKKLVEQNMAAMPKKLQEQMKKSMQAYDGKSTPVTFKVVEKNVKVGTFTCKKLEGRVKGEKKSDIWSADYSSLGVKDKEFEVLSQFEGLAGNFVEQNFGSLGKEANLGFQKMSGFPVRVWMYRDGKLSQKSELSSVSTVASLASKFERPKDLQVKKIPF